MKTITVFLALFISCVITCFAQPNVLTWHNDNARTGQNLQETILTPANVNSTTFGKLFTLNVDGKVDAQPLYVASVTIPGKGIHNTLFVVSEHDSAYAFDADDGTLLWQVSLLATGETPSDDRNCTQLTPEIGITATPVIDLGTGSHGTIYMVAMSKDGSSNYHQRLHALDITTGAEQFGGAVEIQASYPGTGVEQAFNAKVHKERAALVISNGVVYTSWSSHCDIPSYTGWIIGYNETTLQRVSVLSITPSGNDGALWGSGAGPAIDASGNIFALTGNGVFDTTLTNGFPDKSDFGNAFIKVSPNGSTVLDYFTMSNTVSESGSDTDLASGGLILLPSLNDAQGHPRSLAVGAGKDKNIYVVDQSNLGKFSSSTDAIYQQMTNVLPGGAWSTPAWFNGKLYYGGVSDKLKAFTFTGGMFNTTPSSQSATSYQYPGATPSISANGTSNAIVWAAENSSSAALHAYDATDLSKELYNSRQAPDGRDTFGTGNKYIVPTVVNGKVYVGTTSGVGVFGLLCSYAIAPQSSPAPAAGGTEQVNVIATSGCAWTASSNSAFLTITTGSSGTGSGVLSYNVSANFAAARTGTLTIAGQTFTVSQAGGVAPAMTVSPSTLNFAVNGSQVSDPQGVALTFAGNAAIGWTASSNKSNITVSPLSGTGNQTVTITAAAGSSGTVTITAPDAANSPQTIQVNVANASSAAPFGAFETPANNATGVAGSLAVTGWALDNVEVANVGVWREPISNEATASNGLVFIGNAVFVAGARPDVEAQYPTTPFNNRAGWGYLLLTNALPNSNGSTGTGNGTYKLHALAVNKSGQTAELGIHTITVDNAHSTVPFGAIDTPDQGATVSGNAYVNFGWALAPVGHSIPVNGSTITVTVDGVAIGHPTYNQFRSDVANTFPGLANSAGPAGYLRIDTTALANGVHTIAWLLTDSSGQAAGVGSRYFQVLNGVSGSAAAFEQQVFTSSTSGGVRIVRALNGEAEAITPTETGSYVLHASELERIELQLHASAGVLLVNGERRPLPIGSTIQGGVFYWQLGPGFLGKYQLEFERPGAASVRVNINVRTQDQSRER